MATVDMSREELIDSVEGGFDAWLESVPNYVRRNYSGAKAMSCFCLRTPP